MDYRTDAKKRLAECGGTLRITLSDTKPAPWEEEESRYRPHYRCTLKGPGGSYTFDFWGSVSDGEKGERATEYDVLACLGWFTEDTFEAFCSEFGESADSRKAHKMWKACLAQSRALCRVFPSETAQQCLAEIR